MGDDGSKQGQNENTNDLEHILNGNVVSGISPGIPSPVTFKDQRIQELLFQGEDERTIFGEGQYTLVDMDSYLQRAEDFGEEVIESLYDMYEWQLINGTIRGRNLPARNYLEYWGSLPDARKKAVESFLKNITRKVGEEHHNAEYFQSFKQGIERIIASLPDRFDYPERNESGEYDFPTQDLPDRINTSNRDTDRILQVFLELVENAYNQGNLIVSFKENPPLLPGERPKGNYKRTEIDGFVQTDMEHPHLFVVENIRMSSFSGKAGPGEIVDTFSLAPNEELKVKIEKWKSSKYASSLTESAFDSVSESSVNKFEEQLKREDSDRTRDDESTRKKISGSVSAKFGYGSARISGDRTEEVKKSREVFVQNIKNTVRSHEGTTNQKRDLKTTETIEREEESGTRSTEQRLIINNNTDRNVTQVMYQLNQIRYAVFHMEKIRVGLHWPDGRTAMYEISSIDKLVKDHLNSGNIEETHAAAKRVIEDALLKIYAEDLEDYRYQKRALIERVSEEPSYIRVIRRDVPRVATEDGAEESSAQNEPSGIQNYVPIGHTSDEVPERYVNGVIIAAEPVVMRTPGTWMNPDVGKSVAVGPYGIDVLDEDKRKMKLANDKEQLRITAAEGLVNEGKYEEAARLLDANDE